jgi:tetratricopeptide (TPR) repeat protein
LWQRQHDRAIEELERAIALDPNCANAYAVLGLTLHYTGRSEEAIELINRGMSLDPHYPDIRLHWLGQAYFQLDRYKEAIDLLKRRLIRKPDSDISRVLLAASYGHLGHKEEAKAEWLEALRINPDFSLEHRRQNLPYKDPADFEKVIDGLHKAGLPQ